MFTTPVFFFTNFNKKGAVLKNDLETTLDEWNSGSSVLALPILAFPVGGRKKIKKLLKAFGNDPVALEGKGWWCNQQQVCKKTVWFSILKTPFITYLRS